MFRRQLVAVCAGVLLATSTPETGSTRPGQVDARLYNTARVPPMVKDGAFRVAARALSTGGVHMRWKDCDVADSCTTPPTRGELMIRLVRSPRPKQVETPTWLVSRGETPLVLGEAFIDMGGRSGVLATVFVDRVESIAARAEIDAVLLLGRAMAHELGHLLLGTNAHSPSGLMRAHWTPADLRHHASADWTLTREDAAAISRRLR
jgi:hypothetical protein